MTNDPDQIRSEIEQTRANLSENVNALGEAVTPGNIARRQAEKVTGAAVGVKDRIMGTVDDTTSSAKGSLSSAGDAVAAGPSAARRQTRGNPLAAGLIALGAGWLLGSLLPSSQKERELAVTLKEKAAPVVEEVQAHAKDVGANLRQPAMEAAQSVKETAQQAAETVTSEAQRAKDDVQASAQESGQTVRDHQSREDTSLT
jgi:hypothetical protein